MPYYIKVAHLIGNIVHEETVTDPRSHDRRPLAFASDEDAQEHADEMEQSVPPDLGWTFYTSRWA